MIGYFPTQLVHLFVHYVRYHYNTCLFGVQFRTTSLAIYYSIRYGCPQWTHRHSFRFVPNLSIRKELQLCHELAATVQSFSWWSEQCLCHLVYDVPNLCTNLCHVVNLALIKVDMSEMVTFSQLSHSSQAMERSLLQDGYQIQIELVTTFPQSFLNLIWEGYSLQKAVSQAH